MSIKQFMVMPTKRLLTLAIGSATLSATVVQAQGLTVFQGLPPLPPNIPSLEATPKDELPTLPLDAVIPVPTRQAPPIQEYNFEAPRPAAPTFTPTSSVTNSRQYRVEIVSNDPLMLATVKKIQPSAFLRGDRIQAGSFAQPENARNLQANLRERGIIANVVEVSLGSPNGAMGSSVDDGGYFVAIPVSSGAAGAMITQVQSLGITTGLIQQRSAPRGNHIAIGPFSSRQEAEFINSRIRAADLDGRLYFHN